jgi:inner membrane protein
VLGVLLVMIAVTPWLVPELVPLLLRIGFTVVVAAMLLATWRASPGWRVAIGVTSFGLVVLSFFVVSQATRVALEERLARDFPDARTEDVALSPWPANVLCWSAVAVQVEGTDLVLRRANVASFPELLGAADCPSMGEQTTAELREIEASSDAQVVYQGEARVRVSRLARLADQSCEARAMLQFTRAPFVVDRGDRVVLGDLRFDRDEDLDFAELELDPSAPRCPAFGAPWLAPMQSIFRDGFE